MAISEGTWNAKNKDENGTKNKDEWRVFKLTESNDNHLMWFLSHIFNLKRKSPKTEWKCTIWYILHRHDKNTQ